MNKACYSPNNKNSKSNQDLSEYDQNYSNSQFSQSTPSSSNNKISRLSSSQNKNAKNENEIWPDNISKEDDWNSNLYKENLWGIKSNKEKTNSNKSFADWGVIKDSNRMEIESSDLRSKKGRSNTKSKTSNSKMEIESEGFGKRGGNNENVKNERGKNNKYVSNFGEGWNDKNYCDVPSSGKSRYGDNSVFNSLDNYNENNNYNFNSSIIKNPVD